MAFHSFLLRILCSLVVAEASVTVYNQIPLGQQSIVTSTPAATTVPTGAEPAQTGAYAGLAAYDPTTWPPPALPNPAPSMQFPIVLLPAANQMGGLSMKIPASFFGFSIEMSVATQHLGRNSTHLNVPFLNLMALIADRAGEVQVRVGGNTQDYAKLVDATSDGRILEKEKVDTNNPTGTPNIIYTDDVLYMMANVSSLVNVNWYLGVPFNDSTNINMDIVVHGERILGDHLLGFQVGNEPDLYDQHGHRNPPYTAWDYYGEFGLWRDQWNSNSDIKNKTNLIGPSLSLANWQMEQVWDTPFLQDYGNQLSALSVENYPDNNCAAIYNNGQTPVNPPDVFPNYLTHNSGLNIVGKLRNSTSIAQQNGKEFIMFETNSASCGGFRGVSNVYGISLWGLDYGLQMAYSNFSHALMHVGGQDVYYNPFLPPPTNQSNFHQWTVGPIFYPILVMPEILGKTNTARVVDLFANSNNEFTPSYAIYENDQLARVALFNYLDDPTGAMTYTANIQVGGGETGQPSTTPQTVKVKRLSAGTVSQKFNITWAGRTLATDYWTADGRLQGEEQIETVQCDTTQGICQVKVPSPGFALVFISDSAQQNSEATATQTYATTAQTKLMNTATIDQSVIETSNGHSGKDRFLGSTSKGSANGADMTAGVVPSLTALFAVIGGAFMVFRSFSS